MIGATSLLTIFRATFNKVFEALKAKWENSPVKRLVHEESTDTDVAAFNWLLCFPIVREFLGSKTYNELSEKEYKFKVREWYAGMKIKFADLRRRKLPNVAKIQSGNATAIIRHKTKMIAQALESGHTDLAHDGIPFFSTATGERMIDNLITGTGTSVAQLCADLKSAALRGAEYSFSEDPNGDAFGLEFGVVVCGRNLSGVFQSIKESNSDPTQTNANIANPYRSYIKEVIEIPQLADPNDWYFLDLSVMEPLILLKEALEGQEIKHIVTMDHDDEVAKYSVRSNYSIGYTFPQLAQKIVNA